MSKRWDADSNEINPSVDSKLMSVDEFGALRHILPSKLQAYVQAKIFGTIAHDAVAPTPGETGEYTFSTGGVCAWLDVFPDTNTVMAGDVVKVIYNVLLDAYSYELQPSPYGVFIEAVTDLKEATETAAGEAAQSATDAEAAKAIALANNDVLGGLAYNAAAPTPGKSGYYSIIGSGTSGAWLGGVTVVHGDEVIVVFTAPSTYTYTHKPNSGNYALKTEVDTSNINSSIFDTVETKVAEIDNHYVNPYGVISDAATYRIDIYAINTARPIDIKGITSGAICVCAYFNDEELTSFISSPLVNSSGVVNVDLSTVTPEGLVYVALSVEKSYVGLTLKTASKTISENLSETNNNLIIPSVSAIKVDTIEGEYINPWGALISGDSDYYIDIFDISDKNKIRLKGHTWGFVTIYALTNTLDLSILALGDGNMAPEDVSINKIIENAGFNYIAISQRVDRAPISVFTDDAEIAELVEAVVLPQKIVATDGDSLTAMGGYQLELSRKIGSKYTVYNFGVGGENTIEIMARQGGSNMYLKNNVVIPEDTTLVQIGTLSDSGLLSSWNNANVYPLRQATQGLNPISIDGIECTLSLIDNKYYLNRNAAGNARIFYSGTPIYTAMQSIIADIEIIYMGTNGMFSSPSELVSMYKNMVDFSKTKNYLIIGLHSAPGYSLSDFVSFEALMQKEFSNKYINMRKYLIENALSDAGITPTESDLTAISNGQCPPSLLQDSVHFNDAGFKVVGNKIYQTGVNLGYW